MDKYEYGIKSDQIKKMVAKKDYKIATKIADTIDWSKVKSNSMLITVADAYEAVRAYDKAKQVLLCAYERTPMGRQLAYRLSILSIKLKDYADAEDFYRDFVDMAPMDSAQYILKYKIEKGKGKPVKTLIPILEAFNNEDMDEKWGYELAKLYHEAGDIDKCVNQCDEISLWFNEGEYVDKAMELKKIYKPLTKGQQERYDRRFERNGFSDELAWDNANAQGAGPVEFDTYTSDYYQPDDNEYAPYSDENAYYNENINNSYENAYENAYEQQYQEEVSAEPSYNQPMDVNNIRVVHDSFDEDRMQKELARNLEEIMNEDDSQINGQLHLDFASYTDEEKELDQITGQLSLEEVLKNLEARGILGSDTVKATFTAMDKAEAAVEDAAAESAFEAAQSIAEEEIAKAEAEFENVKLQSVTENIAADVKEAIKEDSNENLEEIPEEVKEEISDFSIKPDIDLGATRIIPDLSSIKDVLKPEKLEHVGNIDVDVNKYEFEAEKDSRIDRANYIIDNLPEIDMTEEILTGMSEVVVSKDIISETADLNRVKETLAKIEEEKKDAGDTKEVPDNLDEAIDDNDHEKEDFDRTKELVSQAITGVMTIDKKTGLITVVDKSEKEEEKLPDEEEKLPEVEEVIIPEEEKDNLVEDEEVNEEANEESPEVEENTSIEDAMEAEPIDLDDYIDEKPENKRGFVSKFTRLFALSKLAEDLEPEDDEDEEINESLEDDIEAETETETETEAEEALVAEETEVEAEESENIEDVEEAEELVNDEEIEAEPEETVDIEKTEEELLDEIEDEEVLEDLKKLDGEEEKVMALSDVVDPKVNSLADQKAKEVEENFAKEFAAGLAMAAAAGDIKLTGTKIDDTAEINLSEEDLKNVKLGDKEADAKPVDIDALGNDEDRVFHDEASPDDFDEETFAESIKEADEDKDETNPYESGFEEEKEEYEEKHAKSKGIRKGGLEEQYEDFFTKEEEDLFSNFVNIAGLQNKIIKTIINLTEEYVSDGASTAGNIVVMGDEKSGKTTLAIDILKTVNKRRERVGRKIAKVNAQVFNKKGISQYMQRLMGSDLIIENAGLLNEYAIEELIDSMQYYTDDMIVVLEDEGDSLNRILDEYPDLDQMFDNQIVVKDYDINEWVSYAKEYAKQNNYIVDDLGMLALYARIDDEYGIRNGLSEEDIEDIMDIVMKKASHKLMRKVFGKSKNDGYNVLKESDFY